MRGFCNLTSAFFFVFFPLLVSLLCCTTSVSCTIFCEMVIHPKRCAQRWGGCWRRHRSMPNVPAALARPAWVLCSNPVYSFF